jgi:hypothetical protein
VKAIAEARGSTASKLMRRILEDYVDDHQLADPAAVSALRAEEAMVPKPPPRRK